MTAVRILAALRSRVVVLACLALAPACGAAPTSPESAPPGVVLAITAQPQSQTVVPNGRATLTVAAVGTGLLHYQWFAESEGAAAGQAVSDATAPTFTTPTLVSTTRYWARVSDAVGTLDSVRATVTVDGGTPPAPQPPSGAAPAITGQPQPVTITSGGQATLAVTAAGTGPLWYQWYIGTSGQTGGVISGSTSSTYVTPSLLLSQTFWVRVSNAWGSSDSSTVSVTVAGGESLPPSGGGANSAWEDEVVTLVNQRRAVGASCGGTSYGPAPALVMNMALRAAARGHSEDMAMQNYFSHTSVDGRTFSQRITNAGYAGAFPWGENIAGGQPSSAAAVSAWMSSAGHCANIMNPSFRTIGVGYAYRAGSTYGHYWTQDFGGS